MTGSTELPLIPDLKVPDYLGQHHQTNRTNMSATKCLIVFISLCVIAHLAEAVCTHNGITYNTGEGYQDNCNKCKCLSSGAGACGRKACPTKACRKGLKGYGAGEQYMNSDGCNKCTCTVTGASVCTNKMCI